MAARVVSKLAMLSGWQLLVTRWHMGWNLSEEEAKALWEVEDVPHGPKAHEWESPDKKCERYEKALRGILACSSNDRMVIMLQAVAAAALREHELERWHMERLR